MTIGELSKQTGLSPKTIRFYEQINLVSIPRRSENGYRYYSTAIVDDLKMIKYARDLGLPIPEIKKLMHGCRNGHCQHNPDYLQNEINSYQSILLEKISQMHLLNTQLDKLKQLLNHPGACNKSSRYCCNILHQLTQLPKGGDLSWPVHAEQIAAERSEVKDCFSG